MIYCLAPVFQALTERSLFVILVLLRHLFYFLSIMGLLVFCPLSCPESVEQVLPRQRAEGDDQTGRVENVSVTSTLFICLFVF